MINNDYSLVAELSTNNQRGMSNFFDFNYRKLERSSVEIENKGSLFYEMQEMVFYKTYDKIKESEMSSFICLINKKKDEFIISTSTFFNRSFNRTWLVVKETFPQGYKLRLNDVIRIGKIDLKIKAMSPSYTSIKKIEESEEVGDPNNISKSNALIKLESKSNISNLNTTTKQDSQWLKLKGINFNSEFLTLNNNLQVNKNETCKEAESMKSCRICLLSDSGPDNYLISVCKCKGTMKYIHVVCLQKCISNKIQQKRISANVVMHYYTEIKCELCSFEYSESIRVKGKYIDLIQIEYPSQHYLIIEVLTENNISNEPLDKKKFLVIDTSENYKVSCGRSSESDISILDPSISRNHMEIHRYSGGYEIYDLSSKFGTLIKLEHGIPVFHTPLVMLIGFHKLDFKLEKNLFYYLCCIKSPITSSNSYNEFLTSEVAINLSEKAYAVEDKMKGLSLTAIVYDENVQDNQDLLVVGKQKEGFVLDTIDCTNMVKLK